VTSVVTNDSRDSVDDVFAALARAYERGDDVDVVASLARFEGDQRKELQHRLERYFAAIGRRPFNPAAYERWMQRRRADQE
jgi:hypothetical protein